MKDFAKNYNVAGGKPGKGGKNGRDGEGETYDGEDGAEGYYEYIVEYGNGPVKYKEKYQLKILDFTIDL